MTTRTAQPPIPSASLVHEAEDPELLALPAPPKRERTLTVALLLFTAAASLAMVAALGRDAAYAFAPARATDVGELSALDTKTSGPRFVRGTAVVGAAHAIRYERPLVESSFRLMPVAGRPDVWVELRVPERAENGRFVPPSTVEGRLVRFEDAGPRHRGLAEAVARVTGQPIPANAWLLVDGERPGDARSAALLVLLFTAFAVWNVIATSRLLRKVA